MLLVLLTVSTAGIFYQDFDAMYSGQILIFVFGVLVTCVGVAILSLTDEEARQKVEVISTTRCDPPPTQPQPHGPPHAPKRP